MLALNILAIALLSVLSIAEDDQEAGMGHGTTAANSDDNGSMNECANTYEGTHHFHRFAKWMNEKNSSHYSPIHPEFQPAVHHLDLALIKHNTPITSGGDNCKFKHLDKVRNNAHVPLRDRALCSFEYILNYNAK
uniref:Uncharacterized protein n=1 Tax=Plectus sambesii TaxID=2011161 RepID=A0A914VDN9_9BILA